MKKYLLFSVIVLNSFCSLTQDLSSYEKPIQLSLYSISLRDSVQLEIILPKRYTNQPITEYPVIYLLDNQLESNYKYNLHTIDYLTTLNWIPNAIVIGIGFPWKVRNQWTNPNKTGGKADDLIEFLSKELNDELKNKYPTSNFNLLIGHSRTAIFSSYALSKKSEFFNGAIASSVSNFDFGDTYQQEQFEHFLNSIDTSAHKYFYYFSAGEKAYGDLHEEAVDTLNYYLSKNDLPLNFEWNYFKHHIAHELTPGVTVSSALSQIFKEYGRRIDVCFDIANKTKDEVPWNEFYAFYTSISNDLGFKIEPSELFYNSIASHYYNDYDGLFNEKKLIFTLDVLLKAIEKYPNRFDYYSWIGEIYYSINKHNKGKLYLNKALELLNNDKSISDEDRLYYRNQFEVLLEK